VVSDLKIGSSGRIRRFLALLPSAGRSTYFHAQFVDSSICTKKPIRRRDAEGHLSLIL
jgi:hypothetical protein